MNPAPSVVADAGPLHYLVLIDATELLRLLFGEILVPDLVTAELSRARTPAKVRDWLATTPAWLQKRPTPLAADLPLPRLGSGERAAIALAESTGAKLVLIDDRAAVVAARARGLEATGTLGVLALGAARSLIDLPPAITRLKATNFRYRPELLDAVLTRHSSGR